jgi:hypothetical protein
MPETDNYQSKENIMPQTFEQFDQEHTKYGSLLFLFAAGIYCGLNVGTGRGDGYIRSLKKDIDKAQNKAALVKALEKHDINDDGAWDFYSEHMQVRNSELFEGIAHLPDEEFRVCKEFLLENMMSGLEWVNHVISRNLGEEQAAQEAETAS